MLAFVLAEVDVVDRNDGGEKWPLGIHSESDGLRDFDVGFRHEASESAVVELYVSAIKVGLSSIETISSD